MVTKKTGRNEGSLRVATQHKKKKEKLTIAENRKKYAATQSRQFSIIAIAQLRTINPKDVDAKKEIERVRNWTIEWIKQYDTKQIETWLHSKKTKGESHGY